MSRIKVALFLLSLRCFHPTSSQSALKVLERIAEQGFGKGFGEATQERMDTLILWGIDNTELVALHRLPYPKLVFSSASGMNTSVRERCLVFLELKVGPKLNDAFVGLSKHYKAKFVILLEYNVRLKTDFKEIEYFFNVVSVVEYVIILHASTPDIDGSIGYMKDSQYIPISSDNKFSSLFAGRLKGLRFRTQLMSSMPYTIVTKNRTVMGVDVEIADIIARKMGVQISYSSLNPLDLRNIYRMLHNGTMDMYLTRRACNEAVKIPQVPLQHRSKFQLLMPRVQRINYNLQFLKPYQPAVWYMFLLILGIAAVLNWIFWKQLELNIIMVIIFGDGQQSRRFQAVLVVAIQIFKFILLEAYLGQVTSFMVLLRYQEDPKTLEQFFKSDTLLNEPSMIDNFISTLPGDFPERMRKKITGTRISNYTFSYEPGYAYIVTEYAADMVRNHRSFESLINSSHFYILNEPLMEIQMCYYFSVWSRFEAKFAEYLGQLYANGVILKIMREAWRLARTPTELNVSSVLLFSDLVPVFYFLCYGWILGIISLIVELTFVKVTKKVKSLKRS